MVKETGDHNDDHSWNWDANFTDEVIMNARKRTDKTNPCKCLKSKKETNYCALHDDINAFTVMYVQTQLSAH